MCQFSPCSPMTSLLGCWLDGVPEGFRWRPGEAILVGTLNHYLPPLQGVEHDLGGEDWAPVTSLLPAPTLDQEIGPVLPLHQLAQQVHDVYWTRQGATLQRHASPGNRTPAPGRW